MKVQDIAITKIKVGERFRKDLGDLSSLIASIKEKGLLQPVTVDTKYNLLAGGRRLASCKEAGISTIPVVVRESNALDALEIELIENVCRKDLAWPEELALKKRIHAAKGGADSQWGIRDTASLLGESKSNTARDVELANAIDIVPALAEAATKADAHRQLKKIMRDATLTGIMKEGKYLKASRFAKDHYNIGDAFAGLQKVHSDVVGFIECDPPYGIDLNEIKKRWKDSYNIDKYSEMSSDYYPLLVEMIGKECYRILKNNSFMVWWFGFTHYQAVREGLRAVGFKLSDVPAVWVKGGSGQTNMPNQVLANCYETFFVCRKGEPQLLRPGRSNVFEFSPVGAQSKIHATEKPITLMNEIMQTFAWPDSIVCVPYLGSGVTLRAAYQYGTTGYGWDLDEDIRNNFILAVEQDIMDGRIKT